MKEKKWVQHISGQGEKWEVYTTYENDLWIVQAPKGSRIGTRPYLPKSEYRLCDPPEQYVDITAEFKFTVDADAVTHIVHDGKTVFVTAWNGAGYRLKKVDARQRPFIPPVFFVVEKKVLA